MGSRFFTSVVSVVVSTSGCSNTHKNNQQHPLPTLQPTRHTTTQTTHTMKATTLIPLMLTAIAVCAEDVNTNGSSSFPKALSSETSNLVDHQRMGQSWSHRQGPWCCSKAKDTSRDNSIDREATLHGKLGVT